MTYILLIIAIVILLLIRSAVFSKIDRDEAKNLSAPGKAEFIRNNYNEVINYLLSLPDANLLFERQDQVNIGFPDNNEYISVNSYSEGLLIAYVRRSSVVKEWKFARNESSKHIIYILHKYFS